MKESEDDVNGIPTERQKELIRILKGLDPDLRHTLEIECRGPEPWKITRIKEHMRIDIKDPS